MEEGNAKMKKQICILSLLLLVIISLFACSEGEAQGKINKTGIVTEETRLYSDPGLKDSIAYVYQNDLVFVISKNSKGYYVQMPVMNIPPTEGFIPIDAVSFDTKLFTAANHGVLADVKTTLYNSPDINDVYSTSNGVVKILERKDNWILCGLKAGEGEKWVQADKIKYELEYIDYIDDKNSIFFPLKNR